MNPETAFQTAEQPERSGDGSGASVAAHRRVPRRPPAQRLRPRGADQAQPGRRPHSAGRIAANPRCDDETNGSDDEGCRLWEAVRASAELWSLRELATRRTPILGTTPLGSRVDLHGVFGLDLEVLG